MPFLFSAPPPGLAGNKQAREGPKSANTTPPRWPRRRAAPSGAGARRQGRHEQATTASGSGKQAGQAGKRSSARRHDEHETHPKYHLWDPLTPAHILEILPTFRQWVSWLPFRSRQVYDLPACLPDCRSRLDGVVGAVVGPCGLTMQSLIAVIVIGPLGLRRISLEELAILEFIGVI